MAKTVLCHRALHPCSVTGNVPGCELFLPGSVSCLACLFIFLFGAFECLINKKEGSSEENMSNQDRGHKSKMPAFNSLGITLLFPRSC